MSRSERVLAYDAIRVFAILSVVGIHSLMPYRRLLPPTSGVRIADDLLHYAVPLFVFISGALLWSRPFSAEPRAYRDFVARRAALILVPYAAWSALYFTLLAWRSGGVPSAERTVGLLLSGHTWYHLYFIPMLFTFYLLTPLASRLARFSPELLLLVCYWLRIGLGSDAEVLAASALGEFGRLYAMHVLAHLPHMALGAWFAIRLEVLPKRWWLSALLVAFGTAVLTAASFGAHLRLPALAQRFVYPVGLAPTVVGITLAGLLLEPRLRRFSSAIGTAAALAFGVYLVHPLLLLGIDIAVANDTRRMWMQPLFWTPVFFGVVAGSFGLSALLARYPLSCRLVGLPRPLRSLSGDARGSG